MILLNWFIQPVMLSFWYESKPKDNVNKVEKDINFSIKVKMPVTALIIQ